MESENNNGKSLLELKKEELLNRIRSRDTNNSIPTPTSTPINNPVVVEKDNVFVPIKENDEKKEEVKEEKVVDKTNEVDVEALIRENEKLKGIIKKIEDKNKKPKNLKIHDWRFFSQVVTEDKNILEFKDYKSNTYLPLESLSNLFSSMSLQRIRRNLKGLEKKYKTQFLFDLDKIDKKLKNKAHINTSYISVEGMILYIATVAQKNTKGDEVVTLAYKGEVYNSKANADRVKSKIFLVK